MLMLPKPTNNLDDVTMLKTIEPKSINLLKSETQTCVCLLKDHIKVERFPYDQKKQIYLLIKDVLGDENLSRNGKQYEICEAAGFSFQHVAQVPAT
jgi:hypothetical protein